MTRGGLDLLSCPDGCCSAIEVAEGRWERDNLDKGVLACGQCGRRFAVEEGIARMLPADLASASPASTSTESEKKRTEMQARDAQVGDYDRMWHLNLFGLIEIPAMLANLSLRRDHLLLEAGCGTGRMTPKFAARSRHLVCIDFSWESLRACRIKLRRKGITNVDLVQADICRLPLRSGAFDRVVSGQVLEHIPTEEAREAAVADLARVLKPGGNLVISAYQYSSLTRLFCEKEGEHAGGIPFFRFTREELRGLLSRHFRVESVTGALVYHYIARCGREDNLMAQSQPRKATWRMGVRERMRIQAVVIGLICILLFFAFRPYFIMLVQRRDFQTCQSNVLAIARAITTYSSDYDGTLPTGAGWMDAALGNMTARSNTGFRKEDYFHCPLDKAGSPSSYAYNDLLAGLSPDIRSNHPEDESRRKAIGHMDRAVLILEKHGSAMNAHQTFSDWDAVAAAMTTVHDVGGPTGSLVYGNGSPGSKNREQLENLQGRKF